MKLCVVGTGYVGLVAGACFAKGGNHVTCVDINEAKIQGLRHGVLPIYEPGLEEVVKTAITGGFLDFSTQLPQSIQGADIALIAVGTPQANDGSADLSQVFACAKEIVSFLTGPCILVVKSTVPVGTQDQLRAATLHLSSHPVAWVSNPEFLREGLAVHDFFHPDRVILGSRESHALDVMSSLYEPFVRKRSDIFCMAPRDAEMTKYAANAMLATRISFMNELALLCEKAGVDIEQVRRGIGSDHRIGSHFLYAGVGYGGSCFPKDTQAILAVARTHGVSLEIIEAVENANARQKQLPFQKLKRLLPSLEGATIAIWGLAFKPETDDIREAPALELIRMALSAGCFVRAHDPIAIPHTQAFFAAEAASGRLTFFLKILTKRSNRPMPSFLSPNGSCIAKRISLSFVPAFAALF